MIVNETSSESMQKKKKKKMRVKRQKN